MIHNQDTQRLAQEAEQDIRSIHEAINQLVERNQSRVLTAFQEEQVSDSHFNPTTGYGYDDFGREKLEAVYARIFGGEDALVRPQIVSGTHAITVTLFGLLRPNDELLYITGRPYDTLEEIVGARGSNNGSLKDFHIGYEHVELTNKGTVDYQRVKEAMTEYTKVIGIQRSKGYADRPSFTMSEIKEMIEYVKQINPNVIVFVDNCYGEFAEDTEPLHVGADIIAGSLIKNPGGGIVRTGGYIVGSESLVEQCANRLTAPGLGKETGATLNTLQEMFQGIFLAPHVVGEAMKGAVFTSRYLELLGFQTSPRYDAPRTDLIQSVTFNTAEQMISFCQEIQQASPINSHVKPYPSAMPGYENDVIMAAGTFIQGASLELTADGPIREPYMAFVQGGLTYAHVKLAIKAAVQKIAQAT
ncbi:aminotransferase class I/II-fold pyridoxal phosphate-dependent enzyme [Pontibacillus salicampi]|uniref:Aminotransferase class I/II-fold pyridoxal phosphate-dependent enzyme n=1 Tax=Pontibacillus salicampi TaxID=1449801 RepID=A0ABV6LRQ5_9BACI